jgi:glycosyltransferase involved in cell wall biosynthesis
MKIGFDVSQTGADKAGCGVVADNLARQLPAILPDDEFILYPTFGDLYWDDHWEQGTFCPALPRVQRGFAHTSQEAARDFWRQPPAALDATLGSPDLVHSNNFFCPVGLQAARLVYTLHDLNFLEHPGWSDETNRIGCFGGVFNAALHADFVIAVSEFSRRHFLSTFPHYPADRTTVAHLASRFADTKTASAGVVGNVAPSERLARFSTSGFWLAVGTIEPRKNYDGLVRAYARLRAEQPDTPPLVIAGKTGWLMQRFPALLAELGITRQVILLGYVSDDELRWLYGHCFAVVYPTFWEGFGLPVIEALHHGVPVISSNVSSIPEVLGDAGLLIDPHDIGTLVAAMQALAVTPGLRDQLVERAKRQAARFSWQTTARQVAEVYREVLARPRYAATASIP